MENVFTVGEISREIKVSLEKSFSKIHVKGELSAFKRHSSGHCYFALKDENSVLDAVMWKGNAARLNFAPQEGMAVVCNGNVTTFQGRSKYQLIVDSIAPEGEGALNAALETLKRKLAAEGLFAAERKKKTPYLSQTVGLITSPTGAVIRDILHRFRERFTPRTLIYPVKVQGQGASEEGARAVAFFNRLKQEPDLRSSLRLSAPDLIIIARGGGSVEDLWPFNEEPIIRAVAASEIPVISAVGHETDVTLIDFAADLRAPTPTAAAEIATLVKNDLFSAVNDLNGRLLTASGHLLKAGQERLKYYRKILSAPPASLYFKMQQADNLFIRFQEVGDAAIARKRHLFEMVGNGLRKQSALALTVAHREKTAFLSTRLTHAFQGHVLKIRDLQNRQQEKQAELERRILEAGQRFLKEKKNMIEALEGRLEGLSYKNTLKRGFAVLRSEKGVLSSVRTVKGGEIIRAELKDGEVTTIVQEVL